MPLMLYKIRLTQHDYRRCVNWKEGKVDNVLFIKKGLKKRNKAYLLCHGTKDGLVKVNGNIMTIKTLLTILVKHGLKEDGIELIETISCYGGLQKEITLEGVTIKSFHKSTKEIEANVKCNLDNKSVSVKVAGDSILIQYRNKKTQSEYAQHFKNLVDGFRAKEGLLVEETPTKAP